MLPSISKHKFYLCLIFFIFLSSIFNFNLFNNYQNKFILKNIIISGLPNHEKKMVEKELYNFYNKNIFKLSEDKVIESLNKFNFLENIYINKIIPSSINIKLSKTDILAKTLINGEEFYIGKNGKFITSDQLFEKKEKPIVFGNFKIDNFVNLYENLSKNKINPAKIEKYYYFKNKRWDLLFSNGHTLMLPSKNVEESMQIYKKLLKSKKLINTKIVDLRVPNQIILTNNNE
tara:strand:+ start:309 stop:1004 length:696 start_codon:yes stop_codon:yes gene_type:complete